MGPYFVVILAWGPATRCGLRLVWPHFHLQRCPPYKFITGSRFEKNEGIAQRRNKSDANNSVRAVTVHRVPEEVTAIEERSFLRDLQQDVETERPRLVLDCSRVQRMDNATIHLLLCCLEEGMKRNGDVKLASLPPGAQATLRLTGVNRLFEIYATTAEAVNSFRKRPVSITPPELAADGLHRGSETAA